MQQMNSLFINDALVTKCHRLQKKVISDFSIEELRIMIGQNIGLDFLIPLALEKLSENILSEGDFYEGDLLINVLRSDKKYWELKKEDWEMMCNLFVENKFLLDNSDNVESIKREWEAAYSEFEKTNKK